MAVAEPESPTRRRAPRVDAIRNREAIVEAATAVLAEQGTAVDVREIARRSGVGMGTLYRHFPKKEDLVHEVLRQEFTGWAESARREAIGAEDPWAALTGFYQQALTGYARHRAIMENFALACSSPDLDGIRQLRLVIEELCARATDLLRPGVTTDDLLLLLVSLGHAVQVTDEHHPQRWHRLLHISLDGLRADHRSPLPADAAPGTDRKPDSESPPAVRRPSTQDSSAAPRSSHEPRRRRTNR
ncbi:helix-turn-helix domain-containing protein [Amycolatopsis minnesotensis]|uniref:TetR/AcrR family transcriptional regulator n=1 Tax=Amycolatopsis minnesotensis TaxID=337894 RepID=A0ABN2QAH0_9PSEU